MLGSPCYRLSTAQLVHSTGGTRNESVRYTASDFCAELFSCSPPQRHLIKHPRLFTSCPVSPHPNYQVVYPWNSGTRPHRFPPSDAFNKILSNKKSGRTRFSTANK